MTELTLEQAALIHDATPEDVTFAPADDVLAALATVVPCSVCPHGGCCG